MCAVLSIITNIRGRERSYTVIMCKKRKCGDVVNTKSETNRL